MLTAPPVFRSVLLFRVSFYCLASYQVLLTLYLYGEWLFGAQPTNFIHPLVFMQTIGFFLVANIGAIARLEDQARAMFSVGCLFWLLVFITNFQHVAIALDRRKERPQPTFFLFIAPPAQAAAAVVVMDLAESQAQSGLLDTATPGEWPELAQGFLFVDLFLYLLIFRLFPTFWTSTFAVTWWAYIFPMSAAAGSVIWRYRSESILFYGILGIILGLIACIAMLVVSIATTWAFLTQRLPRNLASRKAYYTYYVSTRPYTNEEDRREEYTNNEII